MRESTSGVLKSLDSQETGLNSVGDRNGEIPSCYKRERGEERNEKKCKYLSVIHFNVPSIDIDHVDSCDIMLSKKNPRMKAVKKRG